MIFACVAPNYSSRSFPISISNQKLIGANLVSATFEQWTYNHRVNEKVMQLYHILYVKTLAFCICKEFVNRFI